MVIVLPRSIRSFIPMRHLVAAGCTASGCAAVPPLQRLKLGEIFNFALALARDGLLFSK